MDFEKELQKYYSSLNWEERNNAGQILNDYLRQGKNLRFTYLAFCQLKGRSILKYRFLMFNKSFQDEVQIQYLQSIAEDLDNVLFNGLASDEDLRAIQKWIDVDACNRVERSLIKVNWGNDEKYRSALLHYLFRLLDSMKDIDVNAIDNLINTIIEKEEN